MFHEDMEFMCLIIPESTLFSLIIDRAHSVWCSEFHLSFWIITLFNN